MILLVWMLAACSSTLAPVPAAVPDGLEFSVYQTRVDPGARQLQFHIENQSGEEVTFTRARLDSALFDSPVVWEGASTVPAGFARDLKALLPEAVCPVPAELEVTASFEFSLADGSTGTATVVPGDPNEVLAGLTSADCLQAALAAHTAIEFVSVELPGEPGVPATMTLQLTPTAAPGELRLHAIESTVLLSLLDDAGEQVESRELDITLSAESGPQQLLLPIAPNRCDPHAVAEDKQGTLFPLVFSTSDDDLATVRITAPDAIRSKLYAFVAEFCQF